MSALVIICEQASRHQRYERTKMDMPGPTEHVNPLDE